MVRAKFRVEAIEKKEDGSGEVRLSPVVGGSSENDAFYKFTPSGSISLTTINPSAIAQFEKAKEFYVDFTPVPATAPPPTAA